VPVPLVDAIHCCQPIGLQVLGDEQARRGQVSRWQLLLLPFARLVSFPVAATAAAARPARVLFRDCNMDMEEQHSMFFDCDGTPLPNVS
jgi:hypothetical protein